jgi:CRISPR system Cascade subunit CasD
MPSFLILKLDSPMQAWGDHTYEDYRPSRDFPTRSGLLGLLAACLGIEREDAETQARLAGSVEFTVRADLAVLRPESDGKIVSRHSVRLEDFHTVKAARLVKREASGLPKTNPNPIISRREYLHDAHFTVAVGQRDDAAFSLEDIECALRKPVYTPSLGRRSCPLARPLLDSGNATVSADNGIEALAKLLPVGGMIYSETASDQGKPVTVRDIPMHRKKRQFATRKVYVHKEQEVSDVHQPS